MKRIPWPVWIALAAGLVLPLVVLVRGSRDFIAPVANPVRDSEAFEPVRGEIDALLRAGLVAAILERAPARLEPTLHADFRARMPRLDAGRNPAEGGIARTEVPCDDLEDLDHAGFAERLREFLAPLEGVDRCALHCTAFLLEPDGSRATGAYRLHVGARSGETRRTELRAEIVMEVVNVDGWRLRRLRTRSAARIDGRMAPFVDITRKAGLDFGYTEAERETIQAAVDTRRSGTVCGGLSVLDWNGDDFPDLLATHWERRAVLFVNDGRGGFRRRAVPGEPAAFVLHADLDDDGVAELVTTDVMQYGPSTASLAIHVRRGDGWERAPTRLVFANPPDRRHLRLPHIAIADVDGDGRPDLLVSGYNHADSYRGFNLVDAQTGQRNLLFMNRGGLRFTEEAERRGVASTSHTYLAGFFDEDGDGDPDLFEVNDFGPNRFHRNAGDGTFREEPDMPFARGLTYGMGLAFSDLDNRGSFSIYSSNMYSHAGQRMVPLAEDLDPESRAELLRGALGNTLFERREGTWVETAAARGVHRAGWAWGCAVFDADNDGDRDIHVVNGFSSHRDAGAPDY